MNQINRRSVALLLFLSLLLIQFGHWQGQINDVQSAESSGNTLFLVLYVPLLYVMLRFGNGWGYLKAFQPVRRPLLIFLIAIVGVGLLRGELTAAVRNMASIVFTYSIILGLAAMSFSLPFRRMMDVYIIFIAYVFLPVTIYVHITTVGPLLLFPDRLDSNNLRLGGIIYYAHTAMLLGIGGLFCLFQLLNQRSRKARFYYGTTFLGLNLFLLYTDCRSSWGGVALSYTMVVLFSLPARKRWLLVGVTAIVTVLFYSGVFTINTGKQYQTSDDLVFRMTIWGLAVEGISERPLTGYGTENYFASNRKAMDMDERLIDPHSATLSLALQSGLLVVVLFFSLYISIVRHYYRYATGSHKPLVAVGVFWLFVPFFWGTVYNGAAGFIQILFPLTCLVSLLHPNLYHLLPARRPRRIPADQPVVQTLELAN